MTRSVHNQLLMGPFWPMEHHQVRFNSCLRQFYCTDREARHLLPESSISKIFFPTKIDLLTALSASALPKGERPPITSETLLLPIVEQIMAGTCPF